MYQVVIPRPFEVELAEAPRPAVQRDEDVLVCTEFSGVSLGTEKIYFNGTWERNLEKYPIYPGYEAVGVVEEVGKAVTGLAPGDRVITFGNHAGYVCVPARLARYIPPHIRPEKATLAILGATAIHAVERGQIPAGGRVAIFGAGVLGLLLLQQARLAGAGFIMLSDTVPRKLEIARILGADLTVNPADGSPSEALQSNGGLADVCFEVAGGAPQGQETAMLAAKEQGRVLLMGGGDAGMIRYPYRPFFEKELTVLASRGTGGAESFTRSVEGISSGKIQVEAIPTEIVPVTQIGAIYQALAAGNYSFIHVVLQWTEE